MKTYYEIVNEDLFDGWEPDWHTGSIIALSEEEYNEASRIIDKLNGLYYDLEAYNCGTRLKKCTEIQVEDFLADLNTDLKRAAHRIDRKNKQTKEN